VFLLRHDAFIFVNVIFQSLATPLFIWFFSIVSHIFKILSCTWYKKQANFHKKYSKNYTASRPSKRTLLEITVNRMELLLKTIIPPFKTKNQILWLNWKDHKKHIPSRVKTKLYWWNYQDQESGSPRKERVLTHHITKIFHNYPENFVTEDTY